jgi:ABC-type nitrate/sulfonate/bicarbonate transport system permease component
VIDAADSAGTAPRAAKPSVSRPAGATGRRPRIGDRALPWLTVGGAIALFEILPLIGVLPSDNFPPVLDSIAKLADEATTTGFWSAVLDTVEGWALGLGIAAAIGIPLGILIGSSRLLYRALRPVIEFLRPVPSVALIPLAILIYGTGIRSAVFLAAFAALWQILVQTLYGVQDTDPVATDTARAFRLRRSSRLLRVTLPSAVPYIATGLRIASSVSLILVVTAELVIGTPGLGQAINVARQGGNVELMYALIIATGLLGYLLNLIFVWGERRVLFWHPSQRSPSASRGW